MAIPVIEFSTLNGYKKGETMALVHEPCENGAFFCQTVDEYIEELIKLAKKLAMLMSENLVMEKDYIMEAFSKSNGPAMGTIVAKYPQFLQPELVRGLREHTDAGGIILLRQDDKVPGLEFYKDGKWVEIEIKC
ncbi:1-aminocyclopropane-1-carboxylate oxidase 1-like [Gastrolobium bilobum]|uniref:1-aminocyclopropane-1-carboxylate oxidase 1-like n=1 Tax=Gastrolobium bilobum TaxID=150636 RepID=UPI002AB29483|nr:1-aminocyclopropane-1-carboxylate oxidase 1-like [Gastrolobium bilobum]